MAHPPQASLSAQPPTAENLGSRGDDPRGSTEQTRTGALPKQRSPEDEAFERAAALLRPAWANTQALKGAGPRHTPVSGTTPLPTVPEPAELARASDSRSLIETPRVSHSRSDASIPTHAGDEQASEHTPLVEERPSIEIDPSLTTPEEPSELDLSQLSQATAQPVYTAPQSAYPTMQLPPDDADSLESESLPSAFKLSPKVRWLAIAGAASLALGVAWALATGSPDVPQTDRAVTPAASEPAPPARAAVTQPAAFEAPSAAMPTGREAPSTIAESNTQTEQPAPPPERPVAQPEAKPAVASSSRAGAASKPVARQAAAKPAAAKSSATQKKTPVAKPRVAAAAKPKTPVVAKPKAPVVASPKAPVVATPKAPVVARPKAKAKPDAKAPERKRGTDAELDRWGGMGSLQPNP